MRFPLQIQVLVRTTFDCLSSFLMASITSGLDAMTHTTPSQSHDSTQLTLPLSTSHQLHSSLPASSSQSNDISLDLSHSEISPPPAVGPTETNHEYTSECPIGQYLKNEALTHTDLSSMRPLPLLDPTRVFPSERSSVGSVDWPPIDSALLPDGGNDGQDDDIRVGVRVSSVSSLMCADRSLTQKTTKDNAGNTIFSRKSEDPFLDSQETERYSSRRRALSIIDDVCGFAGRFPDNGSREGQVS